MVSSGRGQALSEYVIVLALLTAVGLLIMKQIVGLHGRTGAVSTMQSGTANKIAND
jgi:hypothetical protein